MIILFSISILVFRIYNISMLLIAGLGNPEKKYENTRHNVGFLAVDALAYDLGLGWKKDKKSNAIVVEHTHTFPDQKKKVRILLIKPLTYMNNSGDVVQKIAKFYKVKPENTWVIHDDIDIDLGIIRVRFGGSSAGQKGVQSIIDSIGTNFYRFRIGIKTEKTAGMPSERFVLEKFTKDEKKIIDLKIKELTGILKEGFNKSLNNSTL